MAFTLAVVVALFFPDQPMGTRADQDGVRAAGSGISPKDSKAILMVISMSCATIQNFLQAHPQ